jgi:sulfite reductase (ferredoxin)
LSRNGTVQISFSSEQDTALSLHDLGFIPKIVNGERGFKVMLGGGLGSPAHAELLSEFIP